MCGWEPVPQAGSVSKIKGELFHPILYFWIGPKRQRQSDEENLKIYLYKEPYTFQSVLLSSRRFGYAPDENDHTIHSDFPTAFGRR